MTIVSLSIDEKLLEKFDSELSNLGFTTRSSAVQDMIRKFVDERELEIASGKNLAVITLIHDKQKQPANLTVLQHKFEEIQTVLHAHLDDTNCLGVLIASGSSKRIKELLKNLRMVAGVKHLEFFTTASNV